MPNKPSQPFAYKRPAKSTTGRVIAEPAAAFSAEIAVSATVAQNEFGRMLNNAVQGRVVVINRHNAPSAVLISSQRYRELTQGKADSLNLLTQQFDALVQGMQTPAAQNAMQYAFDAAPALLRQTAATAKRASKPRPKPK